MASPGSAGGGGGAGRAGVLAERRWSFVAAGCLVASAALWLLVGVDAAFVVATFGALAWFWDQRNRIERRAIERGGPAGAGEDEGEDFEDEVEDEIEDGAEGEDYEHGGGERRKGFDG